MRSKIPAGSLKRSLTPRHMRARRRRFRMRSHMNGHVLRVDRAGSTRRSAHSKRRIAPKPSTCAPRTIPAEYDWHDEHNLDLLGSSYQYLGQMAKAERELKAAFDLPSSLIVQMYNKRAWPEFLIASGPHR